MTGASPFDQLLRLAAGRSPRPRLPSPIHDVAPSKTAAILGYLGEAGPASTTTLCHLVDLESRLVWGLLKTPRGRGQVRYADGMWALVESYDEQAREQLRAAAALLRRNGWTVRAPSGL